MLNNRPWGANNESLGGPVGPGTVFCSPGGGFSGSRRSGKPLRLLRFKKTTPGTTKTSTRTTRTTQGLVISPPWTIIKRLEVIVFVFWSQLVQNLSDLDQTWWEFFPGVSRSFLNSSGTKRTAQNLGTK